MEDKMVAGAFQHARNYGWDGPFNLVQLQLNIVVVIVELVCFTVTESESAITLVYKLDL